MMIQTRKALLASLALATSASAFTSPSPPIVRTALHLTSAQDIQLTRQVIMDHDARTADHSWIDDSADDDSKLIMDIPPTPQERPYTRVKTRKPSKPFSPKHKEGLLSPLVYAANTLLGKDELNKLRAKIISYHSDIIKSFVDTSDSELGKAVLKQLFVITDADNSGYLDKHEVSRVLDMLGFSWLEEKHVAKIFERADLNEDGEISLEEFMEEAPNTLRVNLVKLAKKNGGELGLLV
jgi:hypothetical protein